MSRPNRGGELDKGAAGSTTESPIPHGKVNLYSVKRRDSDVVMGHIPGFRIVR